MSRSDFTRFEHAQLIHFFQLKNFTRIYNPPCDFKKINGLHFDFRKWQNHSINFWEITHFQQTITTCSFAHGPWAAAAVQGRSCQAEKKHHRPDRERRPWTPSEPPTWGRETKNHTTPSWKVAWEALKMSLVYSNIVFVLLLFWFWVFYLICRFIFIFGQVPLNEPCLFYSPALSVQLCF